MTDPVDWKSAVTPPGVDYRQQIAEEDGLSGVDWKKALAERYGGSGVDFRKLVAESGDRSGIDWRAVAAEGLADSGQSLLPLLISDGDAFFAPLTGEGDGVATTGAHRYWRINVTDANVCSINELEFWEDSHTKHTITGGTIIASGTGAGDAANVFDGNLGAGFWYSGTLNTGWIGYDFGSGNAKEVGMVGVLGRYDSQGPKAFDVQYSDNGTDWTTAWSIPDQGTRMHTGEKIRYFTDPDGGWRHWRLRWTTNSPGAVRIAAAELRASVGGADISDAAFSRLTNADTVGNVGNIFDGNAATEWASNVFPCEVVLLFHGAVEIEQILLQASAANGQAPDEVYVDSSPDGGTWTNEFSHTGWAAWSNSETRTVEA